jgi:hypothetical protein
MAAPLRKTPALHDKAIEDLSFIRRTMEGAAAFTDVPGWGLVAVGTVALGAAAIAMQQPTPFRWLATWIATAAVCGAIGLVTMWQKLRRRGVERGAESTAPVLSIPARKFLLGFWPSILAGAVVTFALVDPFVPGIDTRLTERVMPGLWLLLYGVGVTTAGAFSIRAVPLMGLGFIGLGTVALFLPAVDGDLMMALGFGVLQVVFGYRIARRYGG